MANAGLAVTNNGTRTVKISCFQHDDSTPSLIVSPDKQLFNCFGSGCTVGGDVIAFVMQFYHFDFPDAINFLIQSHSIDIKDLLVARTEEDERNDRYFEINESAARYYHQILRKTPKALAFFQERGISVGVLERLLIGFAQGPGGSVTHLLSRGYAMADIEVLQLTRKDMFTQRFVYPMRNVNARITHFYSRESAKSKAKYLGMSSEHPLMNKSVMFGLHSARFHVSDNNNQLILVEGHNDVLGLHSHGIENVAAMMTAAPSEAQYASLKNLHINNVIVCPDGDEAGFRTVEQINKNRQLHQTVKIMTVPNGLDPDEFVHKYGVDKFKSLVAEAVYPIELVIRDVAEKYANAGTTDKFDYARDAMKQMAALSGFEREFAINELAAITGAAPDVISHTINELDEGPTLDNSLEKSLLYECISDKNKSITTLSILAAEDFASYKFAGMFKILGNMLAEDIEPFTREMFVAYALDHDLLKEIDIELIPKSNSSPNQSVTYMAGKIKELAMRRRLAIAADKLLKEVRAKKSDINLAIDDHMKLVSQSTVDDKDTASAASNIEAAMNVIHERMSNPGIPGVDIGGEWKKFMRSILGFQKGHMLTIAGVTKMGKTAIAQNWNLQQLIHVGEPTLWVNLEMSQLDLTMRNLSIISGVEADRMKVGNISKEEKNAIDKAAATYHGFNLHVANMAGANVFDVVNVIRKYAYTSGIRIVFIDYVQLIRANRSSSKNSLWEEQNDVVAALRNAISRLGITGIVISQLNRGAMAEQSASGQYVSGTIKLIQDSDCFMGIRKKTASELGITPHSNSSLMIEYNRHGPQGLEIDTNFKYGTLHIKEV